MVEMLDKVIQRLAKFNLIYSLSSCLNNSPLAVIAPASEPAPISVKPKHGISAPLAKRGR